MSVEGFGDMENSSIAKEKDLETWRIEVEKSLDERPSDLHRDVFYPVPSCLKNENTVVFYHPKQISFGPLHFKTSGRSENFTFSENFKSEVARELHRRLKGIGFQSLVEQLKMNHMFTLQKNYSIDILKRFDKDSLFWMLARDGCFILRVLQSFGDQPEVYGVGAQPVVLESIRERPGVSDVGDQPEAENLQKTLLEHILKRDNHHPLLNEIVKDMFKLENQLPRWLLEEILKLLPREVNWFEPALQREANWFEPALPREANWFEPALKNLSPVEVSLEVGSRTYKNRFHILQLLGEYMVDNEAVTSFISYQNEAVYGFRRHIDSFYRRLREPEIRRQRSKWSPVRMILMGCFALIIVPLLFPVLVIWLLFLLISLVFDSYQNSILGKAEEDDRHVPTIEELHRIGVTFKKLEGKGISHIKFNKSKARLYLPKFTVDDRSEVILRNLLVMETQWEDREKTITRYVVFMNDLINTSEDVARLRRQGIIANKLGSDDDVAQLWNSVAIPATGIPHYEQIDKASRNINAYRRNWLRVLWAQFWSLHCSKPWLFASLLAGISLLLLTLVQVFCLFYDCQSAR